MTHLGKLVVVGVVALLAGCGPEGSQEQEGQDASQLSPAQLEALVSHIPQPDEGMLQAFAEACQSTTTNSCVNAGYGACSNWSAAYDCGTAPTCNPLVCRVCYPRDQNGDVYCEYPGGERYTQNRYRVCFNPAGASCTEYQYTINTVCGCAQQ